MSETDDEDRREILEKAVALKKKLRLQIGDHTLKFFDSGILKKQNTGGWSCDLARAKSSDLILQVWLDKWPAYQQRFFWYGVSSTSELGITDLIGDQFSLQPIRKIIGKDVRWSGRIAQLRQPLPPREFGLPILEKYSKDNIYFGFYEQRGLPRIAAVVRFFETLLIPTESLNDYQTIENRLTVKSHLVRERDHNLSAKVKARDKFRCRVCDLRFADVYGKELGHNFAEAHHIVPLSKLRGPVESGPKALITVCANCHRMLHRMNGKKNDYLNLRRQLRQRRARESG